MKELVYKRNGWCVFDSRGRIHKFGEDEAAAKKFAGLETPSLAEEEPEEEEFEWQSKSADKTYDQI